MKHGCSFKTTNPNALELTPIYWPLPFQMRANPSGLTVTKRPGWLNITLAAAEDISLPKRQRRLPLLPLPLAQVANSSGVGLWPRSAAHRRTMKPSIIFDSPLLLLGAAAIESIYRKSLPQLQGKLKKINCMKLGYCVTIAL